MQNILKGVALSVVSALIAMYIFDMYKRNQAKKATPTPTPTATA